MQTHVAATRTLSIINILIASAARDEHLRAFSFFLPLRAYHEWHFSGLKYLSSKKNALHRAHIPAGYRHITRSTSLRRCPMSGIARGLRSGLARMYSLKTFSKTKNLSLGLARW